MFHASQVIFVHVVCIIVNAGSLWKDGELFSVFKSKNQRKWLLLITWWSCGLVLFFHFNLTDNRLLSESSDHTDNFPDHVFQKGHIGAMGCLRRDPANNGRLLYSFNFDELNMSKGRLGIFKTGIYKVAKINNLRLNLFQYSSDKKTSPTNTFDESQSAYSKIINYDDLIGKIREFSRGRQSDGSCGSVVKLRGGLELTVPGIEFGDVGEVKVNGFEHQVFYDGVMLFGVQGKRAIVSYRQPGVTLRGHVIITASDGSTLECNHAEWDVKKGLFEIDGVYVLNRGGETISGEYICVDSQLSSINNKQVKYNQRETEECFVKRQ